MRDFTDEVQLTPEGLFYYLAQFSPDGKKIAFARGDNPGNQDAPVNIYVMNTDGSNVVRLTQSEFYDAGIPRWSPDGMRITNSTEMEFLMDWR